MAGRSFAIGDIHGERAQLSQLLAKLPPLDRDDTIIFLGDYLDRGPHAAEVIDIIRHRLPNETPASIVALRGNHEDAWLYVRRHGWPGFVLPPSNGCVATLRSFHPQPSLDTEEIPTGEELQSLLTGNFFPADVVTWLESLPYWYENEHAIFVHGGIPLVEGRWPHPSEFTDPTPLLWMRATEFFKNYEGKLVVFGHTATIFLPQELSTHTPDDPTDMYAFGHVIGIDTGCGNGGFLTALQLPERLVYETRF